MKRGLIIYLFITLLLLFTLLNSSVYRIYAVDDLNLNITSDEFKNEFKPKKKETGIAGDLASPFVNTIIQVVNPILGIIQFLGIVTSVISISFFGLIMIASNAGTDVLSGILPTLDASSPEGMERLKKFAKNFVIGSVFLMSSTTIVKLFFNILMNF